MLVVPAVTATEEGNFYVEYGDWRTKSQDSAIQDGDTIFLPIRDVFDAYHVQLVWAKGEAEEKIILSTDTERYQLTIDLKKLTATGWKKTYNIKYVDSKIYLPINFYADVINCEVLWNGQTNTLSIGQKPSTNNVAVETKKADEVKAKRKLVNLPTYQKTTSSRSTPAPKAPVQVAPKAPAQSNASTVYQEGVASWYGERFHGRKTSSGEAYNMYELTAAHKTLPFGTKVKVTALYNGKSVTVRINDRGPFIEGRVIDLSKAAADQIGLTSKGLGKVKLEVIQ